MKQIKMINQVDGIILVPSVAVVPQKGAIVSFESSDDTWLVKDLFYTYYNSEDYECNVYLTPISSDRVGRCCD